MLSIPKQLRVEILGNIFSLEDVSWYKYCTPVASLYLFGDNRVLRYAVFENDSWKDILHIKCGEAKLTKSIEQAIRFLDAYFKKKEAPLPILNFLHFTRKQQDVYRILCRVPFGKTITYGQLAIAAGIPQGARFVGNCMAKNIFPIFVPCHRVIPSAGGVGNYSAGIMVKRYLLQHEGICI